ncbi:hypothetical protein HK405_010333, partial [Cladochytrium tenue]
MPSPPPPSFARRPRRRAARAPAVAAVATVAVAVAIAGAVGPAAAAGGGLKLNSLATAAGQAYFGTATDNGELTNTAYVAILSDSSEFGQLTPGNTMKWQYTEPTQNTFSFTQGDVIASLAATNGQKLRCHTLVWYQQLPSWVTGGTWTNATLIAAMQNHIKNEVTHYAGQCYAWDVVNEAFNDDGTYRTSIFYQVIGPAYIPLAFQAAAAADPTAKLYYNDYNIESAGNKATAAQNLVKSLKAAGVRIDGVGMQGHFIVGSTPTQAALTSNMQAFTALGVEVAVTELDVRMLLPSTTALLTQQATDYASVIKACLAVSGCVGVTVWDFDDAFSWVPNTFSGYGAADLYDANLSAKPAYTAVASAFGAVTAVATTTTTSAAATTTAAVAATTTSVAAATTTTSAAAATTTSAVAVTTTSTAVAATTTSAAASATSAAAAAAARTIANGISGTCWTDGATSYGIMQFEISPPPAAENGLATYTVTFASPLSVSQSWNADAAAASGSVVTFAELDDQPNPGIVLAFATTDVACTAGAFSPAVVGNVAASLNGQALSLAFSGSGLQAAGAAAAAAATTTATSSSTAAAAAAAAAGTTTVTLYTTVFAT